jgi:hypothetical protein
MLVLVALFVATACSPKVSKTIINSYAPLDYKEDVLVLGLHTPVPEGAEKIGTVKIGDTGFTMVCGWNTVIDKAKMEARKAGGNAIKITQHKTPDIISSCHRITADILRVDSQNKHFRLVTNKF